MSPFGTVSSPAAGACVLIFQPGRVARPRCQTFSTGLFPPPICSTIADPIHHFGGETRQQAEEGNKGVGGVYWFGFWSLIECLEDKPGDIRYPSGQRMGG